MLANLFKFSRYAKGVAGAVGTYLAGAYTYRRTLMYQPKAGDSEVTVRIWDASKKEDGGVGHASIEAGNRYLSVWPARALNAKAKHGMVESAPADLLTLESDIMAEERKPDHVVKVKIDAEKASEEIRLIQEQVRRNYLGYCLAGRAGRGSLPCVNCSTAVYRVLVAGNFETVPFLDRMTTSPSGVLELVSQAEKNQSNPSFKR